VYIDALAEVHARSHPHGPESGDHDAPATDSEGGSAPGSGDNPILEPPFGPDSPSGPPVGAPTPHRSPVPKPLPAAAERLLLHFPLSPPPPMRYRLSLRWPWPFPLTTMAVAIPTHYDGRGHSHTDCRPSGVKSQIETVSDYQIVIGDFVGMAELMSCFGSAVVVEFGGLFHGGWRGSPRCAGFIRSAHSVQTTYT
jgi:hypothetical protein